MSSVRDVVVIGGSAGAVEAMLRIAEGLPSGLAARLFLVIHVPPTASSVLPRLLERRSSLQSRHPQDGEATSLSIIYVAPPDYHLLVRDGTVAVVRGPRENGHRPAIDPLFRSAARAYGGRVIAVVLSGNLDDGASGLRAVVNAGGVAIVQDPDDAVHPGMPRSALSFVPEADVVALAGIAERISALVGSPVGRATREGGGSDGTAFELPEPGELDVASATLSEGGKASGFTCPECHGALFEADAAGVPAFRCRMGHAFSDDSLMGAQSGSVEVALWVAIRARVEGAELTARLAERAERREASDAVRSFRQDQRDYVERARLVRAALHVSPDAPGHGTDEARSQA